MSALGGFLLTRSDSGIILDSETEKIETNGGKNKMVSDERYNFETL